MKPPTVALLADAPQSGQVLPHVAAEVGTARATRLYRVLVARVIAAARGAGMPWSVWYRPADAGLEFRHWLGMDADLRPQASGSLGVRAAAAVAATNLPDGWLVVLRPTSGMDAALLRRAAEQLLDAPLVFGPAADGGLYLIGGRIAPPPAMRGLADAGPGALVALRDSLAGAGLAAAELPVRRTVESVADARLARLLT